MRIPKYEKIELYHLLALGGSSGGLGTPRGQLRASGRLPGADEFCAEAPGGVEGD